jgi:hypothetical protein
MKTLMKVKKACVACGLVLGIVILTIAVIPKVVIKRVIAVLNMKKLTKVGNFINKASFIAKSMTGNSWFPSPPLLLSTLLADIANLVAAQTAALSRVKGAAQNRNDMKAIVLADLRQLMAYVQSVANLNPKNAETIIASSGFDIKLEGARTKPPISVKPKKGESGSTDGGKTWVSLDPTSKVRIEISGLTPGITLMVKHLPVLRKGKGTWLVSAAVIVL